MTRSGDQGGGNPREVITVSFLVLVGCRCCLGGALVVGWLLRGWVWVVLVVVVVGGVLWSRCCRPGLSFVFPFGGRRYTSKEVTFHPTE